MRFIVGSFLGVRQHYGPFSAEAEVVNRVRSLPSNP
jgi:hypothetical protein